MLKLMKNGIMQIKQNSKVCALFIMKKWQTGCMTSQIVVSIHDLVKLKSRESERLKCL